MTPAQIESLFTGPQGFRFARWGRPIVPVVFGVDAATLPLVKGAIEAVVATAGHKMADHDPELGANTMLFFFSDWDEVAAVPNLDHLIPDLAAFAAARKAEGAETARLFRFDGQGAIRLALLFVHMGGTLRHADAGALMLDQASRLMLTFAGEPDLPDPAPLLRAAYDPVLPARAEDPSHAFRLAARL
ncbi:hypothetical protein [Falsirhodobacter halotolerans]|uniref:hypothetical protein n=1 Tax=Falsirhodobacter halotolerans TaxID=1146892 RepID=UPI001FD5ED0E|nr:hypothetical protein [Falsirhodobacter halotolerans]MCJ8138653.1 hypothetical protein [Falsirhodobacter halotolerans]